MMFLMQETFSHVWHGKRLEKNQNKTPQLLKKDCFEGGLWVTSCLHAKQMEELGVGGDIRLSL